MKRISKFVLSIITIPVLILIDQVTKNLAEAFLMGKDKVSVWKDYIVLIYATNRGGFLSFASGANDVLWAVFFVALPIAVLVLFSIYIIREKRDNGLYLAFWVLVISGGMGNLIDRILYGEVIDFINIGIGNVRTGIFNVADLYLNFFTVIVVIIYLTGLRKPCRDTGRSQPKDFASEE